MSVDRAELAGTGAAVVFHAALIAALSMSLAHVASAPEPPAMEVELVDEVGLAPAAPSTIPTPPPASVAPDVAAADQPLPAPAPVPLPPAPRIVPTPAPRASERASARPVKAVPAPARAAARASRIGDDFLKGIADSPSRSAAPTRPSAATFDSRAQASVQQAILRQIRPCAEQQRALGDEAVGIKVTVNLRLRLSGSLISAPRIVRIQGGGGDPAVEQLVADQAIAVFRQCSPLRLPAELYQTASGGWSNININYDTRH